MRQVEVASITSSIPKMCKPTCLSPSVLHKVDRRWVWKVCCPTLLLEGQRNQSQAHKQNRARGAWSSHVLGQNFLFSWVFSALNATTLKPVWTAQGCNLLMTSICTMDNLIRPQHRHTQVEKHLAWQHRFFLQPCQAYLSQFNQTLQCIVK